MKKAAKRRFLRTNRKFGRVNYYKPHNRMLVRLANELGWSKSATYLQLHKERLYLLANRGNLPGI